MTAIKYLDLVVLQMASFTFISRLSVVSPERFGAISQYMDYTLSNSRFFQVLLFSLYNTLAVAVFTTFNFSHYQLYVASIPYSLVRTFLLFINGFYFQSNRVFMQSESFETIVAMRTLFFSLLNVLVVRLIATFMVFNSIVAEHLSASKRSRE